MITRSTRGPPWTPTRSIGPPARARSRVRLLARFGVGSARPLEIQFRERAGNNRAPRRFLRIRLFAVLAAADIVLGVIDDHERANAILGAVVLNILDGA